MNESRNRVDLPPMARLIMGMPLTPFERSLCASESHRGLPADWEDVYEAISRAGLTPPSIEVPDEAFADFQIERRDLAGLSIVDRKELVRSPAGKQFVMKMKKKASMRDHTPPLDPRRFAYFASQTRFGARA